MQKQKRKLIAGILALLAGAMLFWVVLFFSGIALGSSESTEDESAGLAELRHAVTMISRIDKRAEETVLTAGMTKTELAAASLRAMSEDSWDGRTRMYEQGALIKIVEDDVEVPEGFPEGLMINGREIDEKYGYLFVEYQEEGKKEQSKSDYLLYYIQVNGPFYYVEWQPWEELSKELGTYFDKETALNSVAKAYGAQILLMRSSPEEIEGEDQYVIYFHSEGIPEYQFAGEYGVTGEMISSAMKGNDAGADLSGENIYSLMVDNSLYDTIFVDFGENVGTVALMLPSASEQTSINEQMVFVLILFVIFAIGLLVWAFSVLYLVKKHTLNEKQEEEFRPDKIRRHYLVITAIAALIIMAGSGLSMSLYRLYEKAEQVHTNLDILEQRLDENAIQTEAVENIQHKKYEDYCLYIADILGQNTIFRNKETLQSTVEFIGAEYLMLFDGNGDLILTDSGYTGLSLSTDPASATYDFRRLLNGVRLISHGEQKDEVTGEINILIGACVEDPESEEEGYQALVMAISPEKIRFDEALDTNGIMDLIAQKDALLFAVDPETSDITASSDRSLIDKNAQDMGLPESALKDDFMDFFRFSETAYYAESTEKNDIYYYCAANRQHIYRGILGYSILCGVCSFVLFFMICVVMFRGYQNHFEVWSHIGDELNETEEFDPEPRSQPRWVRPASWFGSSIPVHNASMTVQLLLTIALLGMGFYLYRSSITEKFSMTSYIAFGKWVRGFNLFAITRILLLFGVIFVTVVILNTILYGVGSSLGAKSITICRLLRSLIRYAAVLVFLYYATTCFGFDARTILASIGILSFTVSLGAKDLVTDILAGLSIVFEGTFQVGDIIEVNEKRGTVLEIGVRTTTLEAYGGNIVSLSNHDITAVVNLSRKYSWYVLELTIPGTQSLKNLEEIFARELPKIGESDPRILNGPYFRGISRVGGFGAMALTFIAQYKESDYFAVKQIVNDGITKILQDNGIPIQ